MVRPSLRLVRRPQAHGLELVVGHEAPQLLAAALARRGRREAAAVVLGLQLGPARNACSMSLAGA